MEIKFPSRTCSRCKGSGRYSFNGRHSICYKCNGRKVVLTAEGLRQYNEFEAALSVPASAIVAGDLIRDSSGKFRTVTEVTPGSPATVSGKPVEYVNLHTAGLVISMPTDYTVRKGWPVEHKLKVFARVTGLLDALNADLDAAPRSMLG